MPLQKLSGLSRLTSVLENTVTIKSVSGSSSSWVEGGKTHYQFTGAGNVTLEREGPFYTSRNRNKVGKEIKSVSKNQNIDYLVVGGGAGGGPGNPSGAVYGGGGGGGAGGVRGFMPAIPAPLRSPQGLGLYLDQRRTINPLFKNAQLTITVGSGAAGANNGSPSSISYTTAIKNYYNTPTLGTEDCGGGGTSNTSSPIGSGGGGYAYSSSPGSGGAGYGNPGGAGGPGASAAATKGGGGGGKSGGGYNGAGGPAGGGEGIQITLNSTPYNIGGGGGGAGRNGQPGPPHGGGIIAAPDGSGGPGGGGNAPGGNASGYGSGGGGGRPYLGGGNGSNGLVIVAFEN